MKIEITQKLAAVAVAMSMNALILGSVAYLFDGKVHGQNAVLTQVAAPLVASARI
jgi:hypothetical protein